MPEFEELRTFLRNIRIAHHIRGRIRLKLDGEMPAMEMPGEQARALRTVLDRSPGIVDVKVNLLARSCTVIYDPGTIPEQAWSELLGGSASAAAALLENILRDTYREIAHAEP